MAMTSRTPRLGCLSRSAIFTAIVVVLLAGGIVAASAGQVFSPGPLNAQAGQSLGGVTSHAQIANCAACHPAPWIGQSMASACLACHPEVKADPKNFHAALFSASQGSCTACHTEHRGAAAALTILNLQNFDHNGVGYSLAAHQKPGSAPPVACADCHPNGIKSYDDSVCATCHTRLKADFMQPHLAAFGSACRACHDGLDSWGRAFDHTRTAFALSGKHLSLDCAQCHPAARSIADLKAAPQSCAACHTQNDPHQGRLGQDCSQCHTTQSWQNATLSDHSLTGYPLVGKHLAVQCDACHANAAFASAPTTCVLCHRDIHQNDLGGDCAKCHTPVDWKQATIDHATTAFPLTGKHLALKCTDCHTNATWAGLPTTCYGCHQKDDAHAGQFGKDCSLCHTTTAWLPANFDHNLSGFPLTGAHASLACARCHAGGVFTGLSAACSACHADPSYHAGLFGLDCKSCHTTSAWLPAQFNRPHGFNLRHEGANSCRDCHPTTLATYTCAKCHPGGIPNEGGGGGD